MSSQMITTLGAGQRVVAAYDGFEIATDQGVANGGEASAPAPFDLFLASLGTCMGFYVQAFCRQREIDTAGIRIVQSWERDENRRLTRIDLRLELPAGFPDKYRKAVLRAAEQCSVKKVLADPPEIHSSVV